MKVLKWFSYLLLVALLILACYAAALAGSHIKVFNPLSIDPIVSGVHLAPYTRNELLQLGFDPAEIKISINGVDGKSDDLASGNLVANPLDDNAYQRVIVNNAIKLSNNIYTVSPFSRSETKSDTLKYNLNGLKDKALNISSVKVEPSSTSSDAHGIYNPYTNRFDIVPETYGTQVNTDLLLEKIQEKLNNAQSDTDITISLKEDNLYLTPKVIRGSEELSSNLAKLNSALQTTILYNMGWYSTKLTGKTFGEWLSIDQNGNIVVNQENAQNYLDSISKKYDLYTSKEEALSEKRAMTGYLINYTDEINKLTQAIQTNTDSTTDFASFKVSIDDISGIYTSENQTRLDQLVKELGPEFVYINLNQQFMWYYKDSEMLVATPVTTGTKNYYDTPAGLYTLNGKATNVTLTGNNADGSQYRSPVVYWMPFNGGIGIHDADNWRSNYGSDVYVYNGSHGCVNTPREKCAIIYNNITSNCPIYLE